MRRPRRRAAEPDDEESEEAVGPLSDRLVMDLTAQRTLALRDALCGQSRHCLGGGDAQPCAVRLLPALTRGPLAWRSRASRPTSKARRRGSQTPRRGAPSPNGTNVGQCVCRRTWAKLGGSSAPCRRDELLDPSGPLRWSDPQRGEEPRSNASRRFGPTPMPWLRRWTSTCALTGKRMSGAIFGPRDQGADRRSSARGGVGAGGGADRRDEEAGHGGGGGPASRRQGVAAVRPAPSRASRAQPVGEAEDMELGEGVEATA